ncbi:MAG: FAD-dependent oxidoreductase, partial [Parahaliea sp.]
MTELSRRSLLGLAAGALLAAPVIRSRAASAGRVVVVGGGFAGITLARTLRRLAPTLAVTLVERRDHYTTCPFSNTVLAGLRTLESLRFDYRALPREGIDVVVAEARAIDPERRTLQLTDGGVLPWDRLVLCPGVQLRWDAIAGYDQRAASELPHAWQAGPQTALLRRQLEAMPDGGVVLIAVPDNPYRCPPGPYERASLIAHYLRRTKPRAKVLILDAKDSFSKQALFEEAWAQLYPGMIEWIPASQTGRLLSVEAGSRTVRTDFDTFRPAVVNIIPPQRAGDIALRVGLDGGLGFCQVDPRSFESTLVPGVHVLGDAALAWGMPKSAFSAASQARVCAHALAALFEGRQVAAPVLINTCYSLAAPDYGFSITGAYRAQAPGLGSRDPLDHARVEL